MKNILFLLAIAFAHSTLHAALEDEIDALTPEQAQRIMSKLEAKVIEPLPASIFTNLSLSMSGGIAFAEAEDFQNSIDSSFQDEGEFDRQRLFDLSLMWKAGNILAGFGFSRTYQFDTLETDVDVFQEVFAGASLVYLQMGYKIHLANQLTFLPLIALGQAFAYADIKTSDDNTDTTHEFKYSGDNIGGMINLSLLYRLNPVFAIGLNGGYHFIKVTDLKRNGEKEIATPEELDLSGASVSAKIVLNL